MNDTLYDLSNLINCIIVLAIYYILFRVFWGWLSRSISGYLPDFPEVRHAWRGLRRGMKAGAQGAYRQGYAAPRQRRGRIYGLWVASVYLICMLAFLHLLGLLGLHVIIIPMPIVVLAGVLIYLWHAKVPARHALPGRNRRRRPRNRSPWHGGYWHARPGDVHRRGYR